MNILSEKKVSDQVSRKGKSTPFYKLMSHELRQLYKLKLLDASAYVLLIVKCQRAEGWKWTFKVKDFCREWEISRATFYRAVSKLKTLELLHWETGETITVWHGSDIAKDADLETKHLPENSLTNETENLTGETQSLIGETVFSPVRLKTAEHLASIVFQKPSDLNQIYLDQQTNNIAVVGEKNVDEEQPGAVTSSLALLPSIAEPLAEPISLGETTCPAAGETDETDSNDEAVKPSPEETREALDKLRALGIALNPTIQEIVRDYYSDVEMAIAHIKERVFRGEQFKNLAGAFCKAVKTSAKPEKALGGSIPSETNPPSTIQLAALEEAKNTGAIADYFFSSSGITKVVMPGGFHQMPWWEYLAEC